MTVRPPRISGVSLLAAAVVVLLPALAWLQYAWLDQIADADRERRARTLETAASQLAQDFDGEVGKAVFALQLEPAMVEQANWAAYAGKYQTWSDSALAPAMVKAVYFVEGPASAAATNAGAAAPSLRIWNAQSHTFDETRWPEELTSVRARFSHDNNAVIDLQLGLSPRGPGERSPAAGERERRGVQRMLFPPAPAGDEQTMVTPVVRVTPGKPTAGGPSEPPDVRLLGYTIVRLDLSALGTQVLPALVRRHLYDAQGKSEFVIAVVSRDDASQVIFESEPDAAVTAGATPDEAVSLLGPRMGPFVFMARTGDVRSGNRMTVGRDGQVSYPPPPPPPPLRGSTTATQEKMVVNVIEARRTENIIAVQQRPFASDGHWRLVAKHRAGSLEAAVVAARTRNFALSSGILALLAAAIGLIVVSARRADRLARQQLEFVAAVSHELRTPVSVIGAAAGNLADGVVGERDRVRRYGATIQTEARRLAETVERVLQLAGIAAGGAAATPAALSVLELLADAVAATRHESDAAGVTVELDIADEFRQAPTGPHGVARVVGDATALRSAIQNLISNAIKYGGEARWVRVRATPLPHHATRITVEDRGLGIAADDRKHIFEPFYRGREAVSRQIQGSGLGLHLVQRIVDAHHGTVTVRSEPGRGSTFTIDLPGVHDLRVPRPISFVRRLARLT